MDGAGFRVEPLCHHRLPTSPPPLLSLELDSGLVAISAFLRWSLPPREDRFTLGHHASSGANCRLKRQVCERVSRISGARSGWWKIDVFRTEACAVCNFSTHHTHEPKHTHTHIYTRTHIHPHALTTHHAHNGTHTRLQVLRHNLHSMHILSSLARLPNYLSGSCSF